MPHFTGRPRGDSDVRRLPTGRRSFAVLHLTPSQLAPWAPKLAALEREVPYPVDICSERFVLRHGPQYHEFFSSMGDAHFLLAVHGDELIGCIVAVLKPVRTPGGDVPAVYFGDLKVADAWRGRLVPARLMFTAVSEWARSPRRHAWRFAFGAAMRSAKGDVMRAARGPSLLRLGAPFATFDVYHVAPERLTALDTSVAPSTQTGAGVDLSPSVTQDVVSTCGSKDFVHESTGRRWPLVHLPTGPTAWGASHADYLVRSAKHLVASDEPGPACFALDRRLVAEREFLARRDISASATYTVYAFSTSHRTRRAAWAHLATCEI